MVAVLELPPASVAHKLALLLDSQRPALMYGSEESLLAEAYKCRVCDYAYMILCDVTGLPYQFSSTLEARDDKIASLCEALKSKHMPR
jgi:hypothetical protein